MKWESKVVAANQMLSCLCLFKIPPSSSSWIIALPAAILLLFATHLVVGFGFLSVFLYTSLVVILSTILYTASNHKAAADDELVEEKVLGSVEENSDQREYIVAPNPELKNETLTEAKEEREEISPTRSPEDLASNSECQLGMSTSEESEVDWPYSIVDQSPDGSDGSISDEESLIEIALPSGHYLQGDQQKEDEAMKFKYCSLQQKKELSGECLFSSTQHSLMMELLAEYNDMNEEDNLIEIDISMGSIKYSRFEIEA